ncbi:hypothetical protein ACTD5D_30900 [Nocardia takedensis]|uniref:hypothetical protein n=1 Tax=Nocardia takedensis TaxID=259390 RepID=UPI003F770795
MSNEKCMPHGWSVVESAATHSQLAGVLAGFLFTGIVLLFGRSGRDYSQTIALFTGSFFVLALDSYQSSLIAGYTADEKVPGHCVAIWSLMMPASGSLAVGAAALACGVCWLLTDHVASSGTPTTSAESGVNLSKLGGAVVFVMILSTLPLLTATTRDYFFAVSGGREQRVGVVATIATGALLTFVGLVLASWRTYRRRRPSVSRDDQPKYLPLATYALLGYALLGLVFTGIISMPSTESLSDPGLLILVPGYVLGLLAPGLIIGVLLAGSVPRARS